MNPSGRRSPVSSSPPEAPSSSDARIKTLLASAPFRALRELRDELGRGGLPPRDQRTPEEDARIATFFVLRELLHLLSQFRRAIEEGKCCRLVIAEHGRQLGKVVIEITMEQEIAGAERPHGHG